jgi:vacuolar-type H+-ATPase subunit H
MNEQPVLQHLLQLETEAAALVDDAQAESDRRLAEGEKRNRKRYDERYSQEMASIDEEYTKKRSEVEVVHQQELERYRESLNALPVYMDRFFALVASLLPLGNLQVKE